VLSADHGGPEAPGYLRSLGDEVEHVDPAPFEAAALNAALRQKTGIKIDVVQTFFTPYVYLNRELIASEGLDLYKMQRAVAEILMARPEVFSAYTAQDISQGLVPADPLAEMVVANYQPLRSGDVHLVFGSQEFIADFDVLSVAATHGSPWRYDRHVPIVFAGNGLTGQRVGRSVTPYDIAVTLSAYLQVEAPSGAIGEPLPELNR
jgi:hypothetical protein